MVALMREKRRMGKDGGMKVLREPENPKGKNV